MISEGLIALSLYFHLLRTLQAILKSFQKQKVNDKIRKDNYDFVMNVLLTNFLGFRSNDNSRPDSDGTDSSSETDCTNEGVKKGKT